MKKKILDALKQGYKKLGLAEEAFERVAALGETFITSEEQISDFVKMSESLLKAEQSAADRVRTELNSKIKELEGEKSSLEAKLKNVKVEEVVEDPKGENISEVISKAIAEAIKPISDELSAFKLSQSQKSAVEALDSLKATWDYAKGYPSESEDAYERVMELYEVSGKKWTAEELTSKFKEKFNKAVAKKGVDTSKPFESTQNSEDIPDFSKELELLKNDGVITE